MYPILVSWRCVRLIASHYSRFPIQDGHAWRQKYSSSKFTIIDSSKEHQATWSKGSVIKRCSWPPGIAGRVVDLKQAIVRIVIGVTFVFNVITFVTIFAIMNLHHLTLSGVWSSCHHHFHCGPSIKWHLNISQDWTKLMLVAGTYKWSYIH